MDVVVGTLFGRGPPLRSHVIASKSVRAGGPATSCEALPSSAGCPIPLAPEPWPPSRSPLGRHRPYQPCVRRGMSSSHELQARPARPCHGGPPPRFLLERADLAIWAPNLHQSHNYRTPIPAKAKIYAVTLCIRTSVKVCKHALNAPSITII
jgi:hypothetical protein